MAKSKRIVYLTSEQYAELVANETITVDGVTVTYNDTDIYVTPQTEPVTDVQINGQSIVQNGVANVPVVSPNAINDKADIIVSSASGAIASFSDGANAPVKSLTVGIEPVQDLHGYDHPWPAGGGVNRFDGVWERGNLNGTTGEEVSNPTFSRSVNFIAVLSNTAYYVYGSEITNTSEVFVFAYQDDGTYISYQKLESNGTYTTPSNCVKLRLQVRRTVETVTNYFYAINYPNTVTTYSPYSNICPISGRTTAKVTIAGKNLFNPDGTFAYIDCFGSDGTPIKRYGYVLNYPAGTYKFSAINLAGVDTYLYVNIVNVDGTMTNPSADFKYFVAGRTINNLQIELTEGKHFVLYDAQAIAEGSTNERFKRYNIQIELGSTITAYEPYQGQTCSITFPSEAGTVYGGELTVNEDGTGTLVVDRAIVTKLWSEFTNKVVGDVYTEGRAILPSIDSARRTEAICDCLKYSTASEDYGHCFYVPSGGNYARVIIIDVKDTDAFTFVYPLATPITYDLTASQVTTLLGTNNIWADTGDVSVQYRADTKLYIDNKITQAIAAALNA